MELFTVHEFTARRRADQDGMEKSLFPYVSQAIDRYPAEGWYNDLLQQVGLLYVDVFHDEGGKGQPKPSATDFVADVRSTLDKTKDPDDNTVDRISVWLATAILNAGTQAAADADEEFLVMEWVTMHDENVREAHREVEGSTRPPGEPFEVDGHPMRYPGDPTAPIELWINCRCTLVPTLGAEAEKFTTGEAMNTTATTTTVTIPLAVTETEPEEAPALGEPTPWHGVLAPEGIWSGDMRRFAEGSLTWRDLPLPLTWQKESAEGHSGGVVVAKIETIERVGNLMHASGHFLQTPEADEIVGLVADFGRFGVSVDADSAEMEFDEETEGRTFTQARISSAALVSIPAFAEAYVSLGDMPEQECDPETDPDCEKAPLYSESSAQADTTQVFVSDKPWSNFTAADYTPQQWKSACCLHRSSEVEPKSNHGLPIKEPGGALNRNGVHAAAARFNQVNAEAGAKAAAKSCLRGAYSSIGEPVPDVLKASGDLAFKRGPGWITDPEATRRIHAYWTKKGQPGYAKIGWGAGGDFNRCRTLVGEKIAANSPEDLRFLNQICAQWHHDALGIWPGEHLTGQTEGQVGPAISLVAAGGFCAPSEWFADPQFTAPTPLTITDEGRVFGHMAEWGTCHTGFKGVCVEPPRNVSGYAYFLTGAVQTDKGLVPVGQLTVDGPHAPGGFGMRRAVAHYDNTCTAVADVTCGDDDYGIWVAGMIRPGTPEEKVSILRASALSGDWREIRGNLEMVAVLAVNSPGFPVPRVGVENGVQVSLVAAGCVACQQAEPEVVPGFTIERLAEEMVKATKRAERQIAERTARMMALKARVGGTDEPV